MNAIKTRTMGFVGLASQRQGQQLQGSVPVIERLNR